MALIIGIDPGIASCGYGIIEKDGGGVRHVTHGLIATPPTLAIEERLEQIYTELDALFSVHKPAAVAVERVFFAKNAKTAITVGQAQGVIFLAIRKHRLPLFHFTPLQVKQAVTSYGKADKRQVQEMVKLLLNLPTPPQPDDAADGLALAICCASILPAR